MENNTNVGQCGGSKNEDDQHAALQSNEQQSDKEQSKPTSDNEVNFNTPTKEISEPQSEGQRESTHSENPNSLQEIQESDEDNIEKSRDSESKNDTDHTNRFHAL
ncbi:hypothetical protein [Flavobacterium sp.]|uniref:hypothetical protein n=1 Tax=Flavobacterium sp. TaxID=239 RepID=UPI0025D712AB|nr:hypothetical protein [Flavobacterium sp.]